jgi:aminoglycoside 3-N-acetyltransferase
LSEVEAINKADRLPVTVESLTADLLALGLVPGMTVLVHSSLSSLGWVCGGPVAVISALENTVGLTGTLIMPAHSGDLSDPAHWENPPVPEAWWEVIRETMPAFQPDITPTRGMGIIAESFRKQTGVIRSNHPAVSFAAWGKHATQIIADHSHDFCLGEGSPLARLYDLDGWVLLMGVGHANNTSLHLAEYRASYPAKKTVNQGAPVLVNGKRQWKEQQDIDLNDEDFNKLGEAFNATEHVKHGRVGYGAALLMRQRPLVDFAVQWIEQNRQ